MAKLLDILFLLLATWALLMNTTTTKASNNLDGLYDFIIAKQEEANTQNAIYLPLVKRHLNFSEVDKKIHSKEINLEMIVNLFGIITQKEKYEGVGAACSPPSVRSLDVEAINLTSFHKYNDIKPGNKLPLFFTNGAPISSKLMKKSSIQPPKATTDMDAKTAVHGEKKRSVASLEQMLDFVKEVIGNDNVKPILTDAGKWQQYTVVGNARNISHNVCACHKTVLGPSAVYKCHHIENSSLRLVPLVGDDGTRFNAPNICHFDTSTWSSDCLLFRLIKAKPGTTVCHFLATDDILWIPAK